MGTFTEPAVALPSCPTIYETDSVDVYPVRTRVDSFVGTSTAVRCRSQPAAGGELVRAVNVEARAIRGQSAHGGRGEGVEACDTIG